MITGLSLGARWLGDGRCAFRVWAPAADRVEVVFDGEDRVEALAPREDGYFAGEMAGLAPGARYRYRLDGEKERPDPASRYQPEGVHGPSALVDPRFPWTDAGWRGMPIEDMVLYELHVGTFTPEGTFDAAIGQLDRLVDLGVTAVELMPVAAFAGRRNWGYDGVLPYAVHEAYGGPDGLRRLVDACHRRDLAVCLDVVYNHLGPEGNYLRDFGPYFTDRYRTPWGEALDFDGPGSDAVRDYFIENALYWIEEFHVDAFRLDAVHAIVDASARPFIEELSDRVHAFAAERMHEVVVIAESDRNDPRMAAPKGEDGLGGLGLDAVYADEFHHAVHAALTGEREGYYLDFGRLDQLAKSFEEAFVYTGERSAYRSRRHGRSGRGLPAHRFVVCIQNHDQIGNRMLGERLEALVSFEARKLAAGALCLAPFVPMLFMGEEYGEKAPFLYFTDHGDADLAHAVREGRRREFEAFRWQGVAPDPQDEETFARSVLDVSLRREGRHAALEALYTELLRLRKAAPADGAHARASEAEHTVFVERRGDKPTWMLLHFGEEDAEPSLALPGGAWRKLLDTADERWGGPGAVSPERHEGGPLRIRARSLVLYGEA